MYPLSVRLISFTIDFVGVDKRKNKEGDKYEIKKVIKKYKSKKKCIEG